MRNLALLAAALIGIAPALAQDADLAARQAEADRARRELDRAAAKAQAQAAADQVRLARDDAERLAAEARRQQGLAADYERRRSQAEAEAQAARAEADLERRAAEQRLRSAEDDVRRAKGRRAPFAPGTPPLQPSTTVPRGRAPAAPSPDTASSARDPIIAMTEGVAICQREGAARWRCTGPLRVAFGDITASRAAPVDACGSAPIRDLGTVRGLRAFGCGYGLNPRSPAPGNRDAATLFGVDVPGRRVFRCAASRPAGCRRR